ncbi:MAG TPA: hypothetical protein VEN81_14410 [Planctomycetota bacterium]|nr:hypothetical protein [Planctomycetota bacterium]
MSEVGARWILVRIALLGLVLTLAPSSHRIPTGSLAPLLPDGSVPRPSRRAQPNLLSVGQLAPEKAERDARDPWSHRLEEATWALTLLPPEPSWSGTRALSQETKPKYLKFFRTPHLQDGRSPPV